MGSSANLKWASIGAAVMAAGLAPYMAVAQEDGEKLLIGYAMNHGTEFRWSFDRQVMTDLGNELGAEVVFLVADTDPTKQRSHVENLISQGVDAIILDATDPQSGGILVEMAHEAGIPVVAYDGIVTTAKVDYFVGHDVVEVGKLVAQAALDAVPEGNYAIIKGDAASSIARQLADGYEAVLGGKPGVNVVFDQWTAGWNPVTAQTSAENALSANADNIDAFILANDNIARGVAQSLGARNLTGKVFLTGVDADAASLTLIAEGTQNMTVYKDVVDQASAGIRAAVALARDEIPESNGVVDFGAGEVPSHTAKSVLVTKDNLCQTIREVLPEGWASIEEVFASDPAACPTS